VSLSHNKDLARRAIGLWTTGSKDRIEEILASGYVNHQHHDRDGAQVIRGLDAWKKFILEFHQAFPDFQDSIEQQIAEGDHR
jgi:predicted ester cyclase